MRWTELGIQTLREPTHPPLVRAGYLLPGGRTPTALGSLLFERLTVDALPTVADDGRLVAAWPKGDEAFGRCRGCGYEGFDAGWPRVVGPGPAEPLVEHYTPDCPGIDSVVAHFADRDLTPAGMLKCYAAGYTVVLVPGDRQVRPGRVPAGSPPDWLPVGYIGPMGLRDRGLLVVADGAVAARPGPWVTGANRPDRHVTGAMLGRDFSVDGVGPYATLADGDPCPRCGGPMGLVRAVEVDPADKAQVADLLAERFCDDAGLAWPPELAPFSTHVITLRDCQAQDSPDVLWDDRPGVSPGVKFADADLIGLPTQVVIGPKGLARGVVEVKDRRTGERTERPVQLNA